jgi:hypothetical protein
VTSVVVPVLLGLAAAVAVAVYRVIRGWETWGDLIQMAAALAFIGGVLTATDDSLAEGLVGALVWGVLGTTFYWEKRPSTPRSEPSLPEPRTAEQERTLRWIQRVVGVALGLTLVGSVAVAALYVSEALSGVWIAVFVAAILPLWFASAVLARRLRRSGPPFSDVPRLRDKLPRR